MTQDEKNQLRADTLAYLQPPPAPAAVPQPESAKGVTLTPAQQEQLFDNWVGWIYARPQSTWTEQEKAAVRIAAARALKGEGR